MWFFFFNSFTFQKDGFSYSVGICADTSKLANVSVSKTKASEEPIPLGRRNETQITGGGCYTSLKLIKNFT